MEEIEKREDFVERASFATDVGLQLIEQLTLQLTDQLEFIHFDLQEIDSKSPCTLYTTDDQDIVLLDEFEE